MSELRQRHLETQGPEDVSTEKNAVKDQQPLEKTFQNDDTSAAATKDDDEKESEDTVPMETDDIQDDVMAQAIAQDSQKNEPNILEQSLSWLPTRWKNWVIRGIFTWVMIFAFAGVIYMGPLALMCLVFAIQIACFHEIISIGYSVYKVYDLPWFRSLSWYFLITSNYFFYGESMVDYFGVVTQRDDFLQFLVTHHRLISFFLYITGFMWFVLSLVKTHYLRQFSLFAWTHVTLVIVVSQSHLIIQNIFNGLVWFLMPVSMIICNDIMAYMFGFFFGKTPLIKLSPKKTWEGFIGGMFSTVIFGWFLAILLVKWDYFVCPVDFSDGHLNMTCERISTFKLQEYFFPGPIQALCTVLKMPGSIRLYPFQLHTISMSLFASVIGPFGGFFASGFKRAFKIKDFGDLIPGHGGMMDRFDCQLLMATFVHTYHFTFIRAANPQKLLQAVMALRPEDQLEFFRLLKEKLTNTGVLSIEA